MQNAKVEKSDTIKMFSSSLTTQEGRLAQFSTDQQCITANQVLVKPWSQGSQCEVLTTFYGGSKWRESLGKFVLLFRCYVMH